MLSVLASLIWDFRGLYVAYRHVGDPDCLRYLFVPDSCVGYGMFVSDVKGRWPL